MADNKCGLCGGNEFEQENGYRICTGCGQVDEKSVQLADDPMQVLVTRNDRLFSGQTVHNSIRNEMTPSMTCAKQMGIQMAETLALNYCFNSEMKGYLMNYYTKALNHKNFFWCSLKKKKILAAVCAYITLMNHNESIAIQYVCSAVDCTGSDFNQIYGLFIKTYPQMKPIHKPLEELVPFVLSDFHIDQEELVQLKERVLHIISIEKACWLIDGRSPLHVIIAAAYLAWKSLIPNQRAAVDFTEFCKTFGINCRKTSSTRIKEFTDMFIKLAQHIPLVKMRQKKITRNNIAFFIDDIIQYPNSLIYDLKNELNQKLGLKEISEDSDQKWMKSFKRKATNERVKPLEANNCQQVCQDFSDTEIDGYIRDEKEIKLIKRLKKRVKRMDEQSR